MTGTNELKELLPIYYIKKGLVVGESRLVVANLGMKVPFPKGSGKRVQWFVYDKIQPNTSPLTEGSPPSSPKVLSASNVTAELKQYGDYVKITDFLSLTAIDPVITSASERLGAAAGETVEDLCIAEIEENAAIQYVNGKEEEDDVAASDIINHKEILKALVKMKASSVGPHESGSFVFVLHPFCEYDLISDTSAGSLLDISKYAQPEKLNGEIGKLYGIRFLVGDRMTSAPNAGGVAVYRNFLIGQEAFGVVSLDAKNFEIIVKQNGSGGTSDPLNQIATVAYKLKGFACKYLHEESNRITQIRCASVLTP